MIQCNTIPRCCPTPSPLPCSGAGIPSPSSGRYSVLSIAWCSHVVNYIRKKTPNFVHLLWIDLLQNQIIIPDLYRIYTHVNMWSKSPAHGGSGPCNTSFCFLPFTSSMQKHSSHVDMAWEELPLPILDPPRPQRTRWRHQENWDVVQSGLTPACISAFYTTEIINNFICKITLSFFHSIL